jgi:hypothetical protein
MCRVGNANPLKNANFCKQYHFVTVIEGFIFNVSLRDQLPNYHISDRKMAYLNCGLMVYGSSK